MNIPIKNGKKWVPVSEIARKLGYTRQHFTRLCRGGTVPGARQTKGGHWRVAVTKGFLAWFGAQPRSRGSEFVALTDSAKAAQARCDLLDQIQREKAKAKAAAKLSRAVLKSLAAKARAVGALAEVTSEATRSERAPQTAAQVRCGLHDAIDALTASRRGARAEHNERIRKLREFAESLEVASSTGAPAHDLLETMSPEMSRLLAAPTGQLWRAGPK